MPPNKVRLKSLFRCKWTLYFLAYFVCITRSTVLVAAAAEDGNCPFPSVPFAARDGRGRNFPRLSQLAHLTHLSNLSPTVEFQLPFFTK